MERYTRHIQLAGFGQKKQEQLIKSKVLVVGAGGLGCPVLMNLAAMGVGNIGIVDGDKVEIHNLHRQLLYSTGDVGSYKVEAAKKRLTAMNPEVTITLYSEYLTSKNFSDIIPGYDVVIDGTDQIHSRYLINDVCFAFNIPWIYGAVGAFEGQVSFFNVKNKEGSVTHFRDLFPDPQKLNGINNCNQEGVLGILPNIIGHFMANEAVKYLTNVGEILAGKILHYNILTNKQQIFNIAYSLHHPIPSPETIKNTKYEMLCSAESVGNSPSWKEIIDLPSVVVVDVRQPDELPLCPGDMVIQIPIDQLENRIHELLPYDSIVFICQSGIRSKKALDIAIKSNLPATMSHVEKGIDEFLKYKRHE